MTEELMANVKSEYSPTETQMIMCITRDRECTPEKCLICGWLRDEVSESLHKRQAEWETEAKGG